MKVIQFIHGLSSGGAETLVKDYVTLMPKEVESVVVTTDFSSNFPNEIAVREAGVRIECIPERLGWKPSRTLFARAYRTIMRPILYPLELRRIIREEQPTALHIHLSLLKYLKPIISCLSGIRLFYTCHSLPRKFFTGANKKEFPVAKTLIREYGMRLIALHPEMADELNAMFDINTTLVIRNGINMPRFRNPGVCRETMRTNLGIPQDAFVLGHVGRFTEVKNHAFLVDVFSEMASRRVDAYLLMIGTGPLLDEVQEKLARLGLQDRYLILENRGDIPDLMNAMDVFVFPSHFEGLGITLIEAQASKKKCVISDTIPENVLLTDHIFPTSLDKSPSHWCDVILDDSLHNSRILDSLESYDMNQVLTYLTSLYAGKE